MARSKFELTLDFIGRPMVWGTIVLFIVLGMGLLNMDEIERLAGILGDFVSKMIPSL